MTVTLPDRDAVAAIMREVAASEISPRFRSLADHEIRQKSGPHDLVTVADEAAERALSPRLLALVPGSTVVGEESVAADPAVLDRLAGDAPVWVIDPIDGTRNFAEGVDRFGCIVAFVQGGRTLAGWILDIPGDRMAWAAVGQGAWLEGERMQVAAPVPFAEMRGAVAVRWFGEPLQGRLRERCGRIRHPLDAECAAFEYIDLGTAGRHFSAFGKLAPWDHAAGVLIHAEAGGHAATVAGEPYSPARGGNGLLLAPDRASWQAVHDELFAAD